MNKKIFQREKIISASEFIKQYEEKPESIERSVIIPPVIGKPGFGKIFVELNLAGINVNPFQLNQNGKKN